VIFVTVGHQTPFDRLIRAMDEWAGATGRRDVIAQVGNGHYRPRHLDASPFMTPQQFRGHMNQASAVVAHAGTGTIIAALHYRKPLLVLPRLARLGETRNDHQIPTARYFAEAGYILAASDARDLIQKMQELEFFSPKEMVNHSASPELIQRLRAEWLRTQRHSDHMRNNSNDAAEASEPTSMRTAARS